MDMAFTHVEGKDAGRIVLYALSTCPWCRKTKALLQELGVAYDFLDVDLLDAMEEAGIKAEVVKFNPRYSFPTIIIGDTVIIGFKEDEIREVLGK
jgi:glutaredoxin-like protein NrdH